MAVPAETSPTSSPQAAPTVAPIRIGLLAPLQGTNATLGGAAREAARRVVNRANVLARDSTRQYELIVEDNSGSAAVSQGLARKLIQRDGVVAAMLGLGSPIPSAPAQVFQAAGVPVVGWYCMRDLLNFPGPSDFVVVHQESFEVFCPERPSAGGAAIFADESTTWLLRAISAADSDDPREVRDALRRVPYR
ncbi:MAG: ABC transporter substrate-binding protein [Chloroflexota bacterium]